MSSFIEIIEDYLKTVTDFGDRKIMEEAIKIIETEPLILDSEIEILNEVFDSLKEDKTITLIQEPKNLDYCLAIVKQKEPIIKNKHDVNVLLNELKRISKNRETTSIEKLVINFFNASEHIEEDEVLLIKNVINYLGDNWLLSPLKEMDLNNEKIKYSRFIPTYDKKEIKTYTKKLNLNHFLKK